MFEAEFWVAVAFVIFIGVLGYFRVHELLLKSIDDRRERIKAEFDEARRLKAEAEALLATYRRKQQEAEHEAQAIVAGARTEAERLAAEAEAKIEEFVVRRTKMAENKIAQAEARQGQGCRQSPCQRHRRLQGQAKLVFFPATFGHDARLFRLSPQNAEAV